MKMLAVGRCITGDKSTAGAIAYMCFCVLFSIMMMETLGGTPQVVQATIDSGGSIGGNNNIRNRGYLDVENEACQPDKLTVYKVILHTFWSRDKFPKHYPDWRPSAQWSKVFGRSHDKSFTLFRLGQRSFTGVKAFAETGRSDLLEQQSQGEGGIYDEFNAPPITSGVGRTEAEFFVDGNHSRVSLMARIIPSPDWFIGIDSFDLCVNGNWLDSITIEVDPIDAGTDNGFTFTAPNWPTEPQGVAYRITSRYPAHPAGSFFYPYMKRLPAIGTFQFIKVKEYELSEVFHHTEDDHHYEVLKMEHLTQNSISVLNNNGNSDIETAIEEEIKEQELHQYPAKVHSHLQQFLYTTTSSAGGSTSNARNNATNSIFEDRDANTIKHKDELTTIISIPDVVPRGNKDAIMNSIVDSYRSHSRDHRRKKYRKQKKTRPPRDCRVSEWSPWSSCSKSCGIGEMQRRREVIKHARRGGRLCPPLLETKWCGSARSCNRGFYQW